MNFVYPTHYRLHIEPNLNSFTFKAWVEIDIQAEKSVNQISLDAVELKILSCALAIVQQEENLQWSIENQTLKVFFPRELIGQFRLLIQFEGSINDQMLGFYRSTVKTSDKRESFIASTQFEETEARKAFPCFDHPSYRSSFDIELLIPKEHTAISNMLPVKEEIKGNRKLVVFETTPPMPTYLLFFACGQFEILDSVKKHHLRGITTPEKLDFVKEALEVAHSSLSYCEEIFGTPYPLPKLDLIAIPDFAFGAMENWGAMTFRENLLLTYQDSTSRQDRHRIYEVIAHEIVHQWFGDLVSPAAWNYLWLNESFATLFAFKALDQIRPEWKNMEQFIYSNNLSALQRDALAETIPIELKEDSRITSATAPIIYNKGGAILNMLIEFLGEELTPALKNYFENHSYGNAKSSDLWNALSAVLPELPIEAMMRTWITRPGYPLIQVEQKDKEWILRQKRFTTLQHSSDEKWLIPLRIAFYDAKGNRKIKNYLMEQEELRIKIKDPNELILVNADKTGFFRTRYANPEKLWQASDSQILNPMDRFDLISDFFALTQAGFYTPWEALQFGTDRLKTEQNPLNLSLLLQSLNHLKYLSIGTSFEKDIKKLLSHHLSRLMTRFGLESHPQESLAESQLRDLLYTIGAEERHPLVIEKTEYYLDKKLPPELSEAILSATVTLQADFSEKLMKKFDQISTEQERIQTLYAIGKASPHQMQNILRFVKEKVPPRIQYLPFISMAQNPVLLPKLWDFFTDHLKDFEALHFTHYERVLVTWIQNAGPFNSEKMKNFVRDYDPNRIGDYGRFLPESIRMAQELSEINFKLREKMKRKNS